MTRGADWASTRSPAPQLVEQWSPRLVDTLVRVAIGRMLWSGLTVPDRTAASDAIRAVVPAGLSTTHRLMLVQRGAGRVLVWGERFDPRPAWTLVDVDVAVDGIVADLLWTRAGRIRVDQLETGPLSRASRRHARRVAAACSVQFDGACDGVRLISLAPATACWEDVQPGEAPR
jgi:hypothetical protein